MGSYACMLVAFIVPRDIPSRAFECQAQVADYPSHGQVLWLLSPSPRLPLKLTISLAEPPETDTAVNGNTLCAAVDVRLVFVPVKLMS